MIDRRTAPNRVRHSFGLPQKALLGSATLAYI
jgi:hypothetical protein